MNKPRAGDIRVFGLVSGTHKIEDIGMDVPHGVTVTIPGDLAIRSKDLWRGVSQKCLFQVPSSAPAFPHPIAPQEDDFDKMRLTARVRELEAQVQALEADKRALQDLLNVVQAREQQKLDSILLTLQNGMQSGGMFQGRTPAKREEVVDGTAPTFLPSEIRLKDVDSRIEVQSESTVSDVSNTAERLRRLKNRQSGAPDQ